MSRDATDGGATDGDATDRDAASSEAAAPGSTGAQPFRIVAVTFCPTGIAHTYLAAEALSKEARAEGIELAVETQGSAGSSRLDPPPVIAVADAVVHAHDVEVRDKARFATGAPGTAASDDGARATVPV